MSWSSFKKTPEWKQRKISGLKRAIEGTKNALENHIAKGSPQMMIDAHEAQIRTYTKELAELVGA